MRNINAQEIRALIYRYKEFETIKSSIHKGGCCGQISNELYNSFVKIINDNCDLRNKISNDKALDKSVYIQYNDIYILV